MTTLSAPFDSVMRPVLLRAADSRALQRFMYGYGMRLGARRFVAGETFDEFRTVARAANEHGFSVICTMLGEDVTSRADAAHVVAAYRDILRRLAADALQSTVALKLTHLGLTIDQDLARENLEAIVDTARLTNNFVRIDMEQSAFLESTLAIYRALRNSGFDNVGAVIQAYLRRSAGDLQSLLALHPNLRLVKGAYLEPVSLAYTRKAEIVRNYVQLIEMSLLQSEFTAIATHDAEVIEHAIGFIQRHAIAETRYEFQMLYGVRSALQNELLRRGYKVRLAIPFGSQWFPYLMRRLAERPANLAFFVGTLWRK